MENIKKKIKEHIIQGEGLLNNIPKKSDYKIREKQIKDKYRSNEPVDLIGREVLSYGAGEIVSDIFGVKKEIGKSLASKVLKNQNLIQRDREISQLQKEYENISREYEKRYENWFSEALKIVKLTKCLSCFNNFKNSSRNFLSFFSKSSQNIS